MAKFDDLTITNNGLDMIALSQSGAKLIFTKIKLGDGQIGDNDVMKLTDIINERMISQISSIEAKGEGQVAIKFTVDNSELTSGFFVREIGIFAKINEGGEEKLYAYTNAGNYTNYLADNKTPIDAIITKIDLAIGNATDINFTVDKSIVYVSLEDLETNLQKHNSNIDSHEEAFTKHNDDENAHENLVNMLKEIIENSGINILKRKKSYNVGDIAYSTKITSTTHLASKLYLECIQAGTTGTEEPTLINIGLNDEITDGAAKFKVYDVGLQSLPVGSIYQSTIATSPENLFGGTWEAMPAGRVLLAQGESDWGTTYEAGSSGGEATHQLTVRELPTVTPKGAIALNVWANDTVAIVNGGHTFSGSSDRFDYRNPSISGTASFTGKPFGSNQAHNNIQPYISCYIWKRIS